VLSLADSELSVIVRAYDLILWLIPTIDKFPRPRKFTLGDRMEVLALQVLEGLVEARYSRQKSALLRRANLELEKLRFLLRLAKDLQCLPIKSYKHASRLVDDIRGGTPLPGQVSSAAHWEHSVQDDVNDANDAIRVGASCSWPAAGTRRMEPERDTGEHRISSPIPGGFPAVFWLARPLQRRVGKAAKTESPAPFQGALRLFFR
jgi:hypothetical protein